MDMRAIMVLRDEDQGLGPNFHRLTVAFWHPAVGDPVPLPDDWTSQVPDAKPEELAELRSGRYVETVISEIWPRNHEAFEEWRACAPDGTNDRHIEESDIPAVKAAGDNYYSRGRDEPFTDDMLRDCLREYWHNILAERRKATESSRDLKSGHRSLAGWQE